MNWQLAPLSLFHWAALCKDWPTFLLKVVFPLAYYTFHGWAATAMAVYLLFRPYKPLSIPGTSLQILGVFPSRQGKLAQTVATTVTDTLLTTSDIRRQAEGLLTEHNIYAAVNLFVESLLTEFRDTTKLHRLASDMAELSPTFLHYFVESTVDGIQTGKEQRVQAITEKIFDEIVLNLRINSDQAHEIANRLMEAFVTPAKVRAIAIGLFSPQNISAIDESIQEHAGMAFKLFARIVGVKRVCYEWRNFMEKEPDEAERVISELMKRFAVRDQVASAIVNFDFRTMPLATVAKFKQNVVEFTQMFFVEHKNELLETITKIQGEAINFVRAAIIRFNPESIPAPWIERAKQDLTMFAHAYLKRELGVLLERAIPALGMYGLIAKKIELFSPQQLEAVVRRVCDRELAYLKLFGALVGFLMGFVQILVNALAP